MARVHDQLDYSLVGVIPDLGPLTIGDGNMDFSGRRILLVAGDVGGLRSLLPAVTLALDAGCAVDLYAMVGAAGLLAQGESGLDERIRAFNGPQTKDVTSWVRGEGGYDLVVVTGTQPVDQETRDAVTLTAQAVLISSGPTFGFQDMYGSFHPTLDILRQKRGLGKLSGLCVSDGFSQTLLASTGYDLGDRIVVTGSPQFDAVPDMLSTWQSRRQMIRCEIGADDTTTVWLVVGGKGGTAEILQLVEETLVRTERVKNSMVIFRPHPRAPLQDQEATDLYFVKSKQSYFKKVDKKMAPDSNSLLPAADYVLSSFSTTNLTAIYCQMPGVIYMGTPGCRLDLRQQKGLPKPPEVEHGAAWYVETSQDLELVMEKMATPGTQYDLGRIQEVQQAMAPYADGRAGQRVWEQMQKLMA